MKDEGEWNALPNLHQFALWLLRAKKGQDQGNSSTYVHALRRALAVAPAMKPMVQFLLDQEITAPVSPELQALAEQVRAVLAQYAPDDPAVAALKASPAYQKVAYLIEGMDAAPYGGLLQ